VCSCEDVIFKIITYAVVHTVIKQLHIGERWLRTGSSCSRSWI
jgi:hypothetical protein